MKNSPEPGREPSPPPWSKQTAETCRSSFNSGRRPLQGPDARPSQTECRHFIWEETCRRHVPTQIKFLIFIWVGGPGLGSTSGRYVPALGPTPRPPSQIKFRNLIWLGTCRRHLPSQITAPTADVGEHPGRTSAGLQRCLASGSQNVRKRGGLQSFGFAKPKP